MDWDDLRTVSRRRSDEQPLLTGGPPVTDLYGLETPTSYDPWRGPAAVEPAGYEFSPPQGYARPSSPAALIGPRTEDRPDVPLGVVLTWDDPAVGELVLRRFLPDLARAVEDVFPSAPLEVSSEPLPAIGPNTDVAEIELAIMQAAGRGPFEIGAEMDPDLATLDDLVDQLYADLP